MRLPAPLAKMSRLRLYQQIVLFFVLGVLIPLLGVSFIIYDINQKALKKELARFTEHTADAIYKDLKTEMGWQESQTQMLGTMLFDGMASGRSFEQASQRIFQISNDFEAVGLYSQDGIRVKTAYRHFSQVSPERRLPEDLSKVLAKHTGQATDKNATSKNTYQVLYAGTGNPDESPYYILQAIIPVKNSGYGYYVLQRRFDYLRELISSNTKTLYDGFYIIDDSGLIIAGPMESVERRSQISDTDLAFFKKIPPGVTEEFSTKTPTVEGAKTEEEDPDKLPSLQKVFVKMPDINWGILIESPYQVRQIYIRRARIQTLLLIAACVVLVILFAVFYALGIHRNFRQLIKGIKAMAEGNYSRRIRLITNWVTPHEITYLSGEFNKMARKMSSAWSESQQLNTELREANDQLAKLDDLKSNLIDTVSHELRTPLTSIKGYTSRLIRYETTLDQETRVKSLKVIKQQADRLGRLVEDLLVIPDLESANLRVFPDRVDLTTVLEQAVQFIQAKELRDISVSVPQSRALEDSLAVLADPDRLEQIVLNLLDNAVKYSYPDTPISVDVEQVENMVHIRVSNFCDPIPEEMLTQLFNKFTRLDESTTRTTRGSGLGLFITKGLVETMGGEIQLAYRERRFEITFGVPVYQEAQASLIS